MTDTIKSGGDYNERDMLVHGGTMSFFVTDITGFTCFTHV